MAEKRLVLKGDGIVGRYVDKYLKLSKEIESRPDAKKTEGSYVDKYLKLSKEIAETPKKLIKPTTVATKQITTPSKQPEKLGLVDKILDFGMRTGAGLRAGVAEDQKLRANKNLSFLKSLTDWSSFKEGYAHPETAPTGEDILAGYGIGEGPKLPVVGTPRDIAGAMLQGTSDPVNAALSVLAGGIVGKALPVGTSALGRIARGGAIGATEGGTSAGMEARALKQPVLPAALGGMLGGGVLGGGGSAIGEGIGKLRKPRPTLEVVKPELPYVQTSTKPEGLLKSETQGKLLQRKPAEVVKEPWQMTKNDYNNIITKDDIFIRTVRTPEKDIKGRVSTPGGNTGIETGLPTFHTGVSGVSGKNSSRLYEWMTHEGWSNENVAVYRGKPTKNQEVATRGEVEFNPTEIISVVPSKIFEETQGNIHKALVKQALSEGKTVPPEVLKDYPDLKPEDLLRPETPKGGTPATWRNQGVDQPVNITGDLGIGVDGRRYVSIAESNTGIPLDELVKPAAKTPEGKLNLTPSEKPLQFIENSVLNSEVAPEELKQGFRENMPTYKPIANPETWDKNATYFESNPEQVKTDWMAKPIADSADDTALGQILIVDAIKKGNIDEAYTLSEQLARKLKQAGQTVQAASIFKRLSAEGMLMEAQRTVGKVRTEIGKTNPKLMGELETKTKQVKDTLDQINKEAIEKVAKEVEGMAKKVRKPISPENQLASKVISSVKLKSREPDPVKDMVNTLFKVAQESPLPERPKSNNALNFISEAIKDRAKYREVWKKAKEIVDKKYAGNPEALDALEAYFNKPINRTFPEKYLNKEVGQQLKKSGANLADIVRQHYSVNSKLRTQLVDKLVKEAGLSGKEAEILEKYIRNRMKDLTKAKKEQVLRQIFKTRTGVKATPKTLIDKIVELSNLGAFDHTAYKDLVGERLGIPNLTKGEAEFIVNTMNKALSMPKGYLQKVEISKVNQLIANKIPASMAEKFKGVSRFLMLLNPTTLLTRNPIGNLVLGAAENIKDIPSALADMAVSKFTGQRKTLLSPVRKVGKQISGGAQGLGEWGKDIWYGVDTNPTRGQFEASQSRIFKNKVLNFLDVMTKKGLYLGDRPFYQGAYNSRLDELMQIAKTDKPTLEMMEEATNYALDRTFQGKSVTAKAANNMRTSINQLGEGMTGLGSEEFGLGNLVMPFTETPANIFEKAIDYSPIGVNKVIAQLINIKKGTFNQKAFTDAIGRTITGTGLFLLGMKLAKEGLVTGRPNKDVDVAALEKDMGKNPYAFKVGGKYYTFDWMQPISMPLAVGIDMYLAYKNEKDATRAILTGLAGGVNTLFKMSFMQGVNRMMSGYSPAAGIASAMLGSTTQLTPTVGKQVAQLVDPTVRETYDPSLLKQTGNVLKSRIPYLSKTLQPKISSLGQEIKAFQGENSIYNVMLNPGRTTTYNPKPVEKMILDIYEKSGEKIQFPRVVKGTIQYKSQSIKLSPKQLTEYKKYVGLLTLERFSKYANNPTFRKDDPEKQAKVLQDTLTGVHEKAREKFLRSLLAPPKVQRK